MITLGKKTEIYEATFHPIFNVKKGEKTMPKIPEGHVLVCGADQGLGEVMYICRSVEDINYLIERCNMGYALMLKWYSSGDTGYVIENLD